MRYVHLSGKHIDSAMVAIETAFQVAMTPKLLTRKVEALRGAA
jgi:hypothetical protein